jgi:hypothetical protein
MNGLGALGYRLSGLPAIEDGSAASKGPAGFGR